MTGLEKIYLDHAATTPVHPAVAEKMLSVMTQTYGNPSSIHSFGREARSLLDQARDQIAKAINASTSDEIVFTSGGTEADNLAVIGTALARQKQGKHIITSSIEHHAVLHACEYLETLGFEVTYLPVNSDGEISIEELKSIIRDDTILVSIMYGNNEMGTTQPIEDIGTLLSDTDILFHTDAVQAFGVLPIDVQALNVDFLSLSAHKINGPKGVGCLYVKKGIHFSPLQFGGQQELKRRAGTENIPGIVGMKHAVSLILETMQERVEGYRTFKQIMITVFEQEGIQYEVNGGAAQTLPHVLNVYFPGINIESFLVNLDLSGIAASSGSACTAGTVDPSHVLVAMYGRESDRLTSSIRFSFGLGNTKEQIEKAAKEITKIVKRLTK